VIEGNGRVAEVPHESACKAEHIRDPLVLGTAMSDEDRRAAHLGALGVPADVRDGLAIDLQVEALLYDALLHLLAVDLFSLWISMTHPLSPIGTGAHSPTNVTSYITHVP
jgi:hypothetical protein